VQYDKPFFAYMDTAIVKAQRMYDADPTNYEASFFLSAAYGFDARLHAERRDWRKATVSSKRSLTYLQKSREANGLSPEFTFGEGLFNYYAVWIAEEYPWLRPILLFFPKGDRARGLEQLQTVANQGFYTGTEARFFRMRILASERENKTEEAMLMSRSLMHDFPDNACFARSYASQCFMVGEFADLEATSRDILTKLGKGLPGYEGFSGRVASYFMGYVMQNRYRDLAKARDYYLRCLVFSESVGETQKGYYLFSLNNLGHIAAVQRNLDEARRYYEQVLDLAGKKSEMYKEARAYLSKHPATAASSPSGHLALSIR
jgi:tetratricopeptide (TPR) repeat protein